jgi:hypothetical protein
LTSAPPVKGAMQHVISAWETLVSDDPVSCLSVEKYVRGIVYDAIQRARVQHKIYFSDRNLQTLLDGARDEAAKHEHLGLLQIQHPPKRLFESAGIRGATIAFVSNLSALLLLLFMRSGLVRDAVIASFTVCGILGGAVAWIGRRRATRRVA